MKVQAEACMLSDLKPGDLYSPLGPEYWNHLDETTKVGQEIAVRSNLAELPLGADAPCFRLTVHR